MKTSSIKVLASALLLAGAFVSASANTYTFDFFKLGKGAANGDFLPNLPYFTEGGDNVSSDIPDFFNGNLKFTQGSIIATVTGSYNGADAAVVQDSEGGWTADRKKGAGLGVYKSNTGVVRSDDNITNGEMLTITFNQQVRLTSIGLNDDGHNIFSQTNPETYLFNGASSALIGTTSLSLVGTVFTFAYDDAANSTGAYQFYLSSLTVSTNVPEGGSTIALIGAALLGLAALRRRFAA